MANAGEVKVHITGDMRDLQIALRNAQHATGRTANSMERQWGGMFRRLGAAAAVAGVAIAAGIGLAVRQAADAEEIRSRFDAVFGYLSDASRAWAQETADNVSRSSIALEQYMSTFQDTFVPLGATRREASLFSQQLTTLAVDLASFNNQSEPETVRALQSAIVGNHETVRRYGVIINEARLEQELLNMGFAGGREEAGELAAAQARLNIIMRGTADAQGDAARTSDGATNQYRAFSAEIRDAAVSIGEAFMPAAQQMMEWARDIVPMLEDVGVALGEITSDYTNLFDRLGLAMFSEGAEREVYEAEQRIRGMIGLVETLEGQLRMGLVTDDRRAGVEDFIDEQTRRIRQEIDWLREIYGVEWSGREFASPQEAVASVQNAIDSWFDFNGPGGGNTPVDPDRVLDPLRGVIDLDAAQMESQLMGAYFREGAVTIQEALDNAKEGGKQAFDALSDAAEEAAKAMEEAFVDGAMKEMEDAFVQFVRTGRLEFTNLIDFMIAELARLAFQEWFEGPINSIFRTVTGMATGTSGGDVVDLGAKIAGAQLSVASAQGARGAVAPAAAAAPVQVVNIDARYATEGTAEMIRAAFAAEGPRLVRTSVDASLSSMYEMQQSTRAY